MTLSTLIVGACLALHPYSRTDYVECLEIYKECTYEVGRSVILELPEIKSEHLLKLCLQIEGAQYKKTIN